MFYCIYILHSQAPHDVDVVSTYFTFTNGENNEPNSSHDVVDLVV